MTTEQRGTGIQSEATVNKRLALGKTRRVEELETLGPSRTQSAIRHRWPGGQRRGKGQRSKTHRDARNSAIVNDTKQWNSFKCNH